MNHKPLDLRTAQIALQRMKRTAPKSRFKMVGSHGHYFIHEARYKVGRNGIPGTQVIVHGRDIGRASQQVLDQKQMVHHAPRVLA